MSAPRRTATRGPQATGGQNPSGVARPAAVPARAPRPVAPKPVEEPKSNFGKRFAGVRKTVDDTIAELKKVNWPDRETTRNLTLLVIALSIVLGLLLGGVDFILQRVFQAIG